jgi:hypothetical protein
MLIYILQFKNQNYYLVVAGRSLGCLTVVLQDNVATMMIMKALLMTESTTGEATTQRTLDTLHRFT